MSDPSHKKPKPDAQYEPKRRNCLMCRQPFDSSWPGERVCSSCKASSAWRDGGGLAA